MLNFDGCEMLRTQALYRPTFSPSTKKITEYSFDLFFFFISRYSIFFLTFKTSTLSNNRFAALVAQKHHAISRRSGCLRSTLTLPQSLYDVRTYGRTLTSEPNFLATIGYQICLAYGAPPARTGIAKKSIIQNFHSSLTSGMRFRFIELT